MSGKMLGYDNLQYLNDQIVLDIKKKEILESNPTYTTKINNVIQVSNTFFKTIEKILPKNNYVLSNYSSAVIYDNKIHIFNGGSSSSQHYILDDNECVLGTNTPYTVGGAGVVVFNNKIYLIGGTHSSNFYKYFYEGDGSSWTKLENLPYNFYNGCAVVYNNKIHILGSSDSSCYTKHYSWDGTSWSEESTLPYNFYSGSAVVLDNKIHILGSNNSGNYTKHFSWNGSTWTEESTLPVNVKDYTRKAVAYNGYIYLTGSATRGSTNVNDYNNKVGYVYVNDVWVKCSGLTSGNAYNSNEYIIPIVYKDKLYMLPISVNVSYVNFYVWDRGIPSNIVRYYKKL